jgi:Tol biopolymer transport system component
LIWIDRDGREEQLKSPPKPYIYPRLSPDGKQIAIATQGDRSIWIHDLTRNAQSKLTTEGRNIAPVWSPDGQSVAFASATVGPEYLVLKRLDASGEPHRLTEGNQYERPAEWSPLVDTLLYTQDGRGGYDIWALEKGKPRVVLNTRFPETYPALSPDGRWLAYASNESGRIEVYVVSYPKPGRPQLISTAGGLAPAWNPKGGELFYVEPVSQNAQTFAVGSGVNRMMAVNVNTSTTFTAGPPRQLFEARFIVANVVRGYDISSDGRRFLVVRQQERPLLKPDRIVLVQNWVRELERMLPGK